MLRILFFLTVISLPFIADSQTDTIVAYDLVSHNTTTILPVLFNTTITSDHSSSFVGPMGNAFPLPQLPPTTNLFSGSNFSDLAFAKNYFNLTDYPMRTVASLRERTRTNSYVGSGMIIGPCFVLTSAINVYNFDTHTFQSFDSLRIVPAFNNGKPQPGLPSSLVTKVYLFKSFLNQSQWDDIALLELNAPIGLQTGWTGFGFDSSPNFTNGKVYHKFSYPSFPNPVYPNKIYNGDTLYYNYGSIIEQGNFLEVPSADAVGIPGQGGSTFLYNDTTEYYSLGLLSFSSYYRHYKITNKAFYQLLNVLNTQACNTNLTSIKENHSPVNNLKLFPNPMVTEATLQFDYNASERLSLKILNVLGQQVGQTIPVDSGTITISKGDLPPGIYFLQLHSTHNTDYICKMVIE